MAWSTWLIERGAVFVMPRTGTEWAGAAAMWITVAGWAAAARSRFGAAWIVTPDAVVSPETALSYTGAAASAAGGRRRRMPELVRTGAKDVLRYRVMRRCRDVDERPEWHDVDVAFVWQHHDLFHRAGEPLARRRGRPLVSYVHAPQVWEARQWGVRRPGWGPLLERYGEAPQLVRSDVVAVVSDEVATQVARLGVEEHRIVISPMAVDAERFSPAVPGAPVRARYGLEGTFVIGWTGSFRKFHGLDLAVQAFASLHRSAPTTRLLLVGDGAERSTLEHQVRAAGVGDAVIFAGAVAHESLPELVAAMDATVVTAHAGQGFHYSPLKMREYMAAGRPVVAPRIGDVGRLLTDGADGLLYEPGDAAGLGRQLSRLVDDAALRAQVGEAGRSLILRTGTWDVQLEQLLASDAFQAACSKLARSASE